MQHDEFLGAVQHRGRMASRQEAERAIEATLGTLAERLAGGAAGNLAAQLPPETAAAMRDVEFAEAFSMDEFFARISRREGVDLPKSVHHARAVIDVLKDAVADGAMAHVRAQLPQEWGRLFESGSEGEMR
jgi:uncharacterized protein (DUF2267 family)